LTTAFATFGSKKVSVAAEAPTNGSEGCMWRHFSTGIIAVGLFANSSCQRQDTSKTPQDNRRAQSEDQLFQKKLECSKFLGKLQGSRFGPDVNEREERQRAQKGILGENAVVFYSPKLNTCLFISRTLFEGTNISGHKYAEVNAYVEDLLTGHTVESITFDLTVPEDKQAHGDFEDKMLHKYGGESGD
jgi:hypothetical protein